MIQKLRCYGQKYVWEFVYGWMDGCVTTFAVVAWAMGANLEARIVLILWFANLFADGFSMSIGAYLSSKSEDEQDENGENQNISAKTPFHIALATFFSFLIVWFIPLGAYVLDAFFIPLDAPFFIASILTLATFALIWFLKSLITGKSKLKSLAETLILWILAAWVAYYVGDVLEKIIA